MGSQPIFKRLYCSQLEQNCKRHRSIDAVAWCKWALTLHNSINAGMTLAILFSLRTVESLENGLQTHSGATPLFSQR